MLPSFFRRSTSSMRLIRGGEDASKVTIPDQKTLTHQILSLCQTFKDLMQTFEVSRRAEQLRLHTHQRVVDTVEDSGLSVEMGTLETQEEDVPNRILWYKPLG